MHLSYVLPATTVGKMQSLQARVSQRAWVVEPSSFASRHGPATPLMCFRNYHSEKEKKKPNPHIIFICRSVLSRPSHQSVKFRVLRKVFVAFCLTICYQMFCQSIKAHGSNSMILMIYKEKNSQVSPRLTRAPEGLFGAKSRPFWALGGPIW